MKKQPPANRAAAAHVDAIAAADPTGPQTASEPAFKPPMEPSVMPQEQSQDAPLLNAPPSDASADEPIPVLACVSSAEALSLALSPPQRTAIQLLTSGQTMGATALAAGVNRTTLYRWLKDDANFQAAYNAWQHDALATARGKILALTDAAINAVSRALNKGDAKTALVILKSTGILDRPEPGATDPEEVKARQEIDRQRDETRLFHDQLTAKFVG